MFEQMQSSSTALAASNAGALGESACWPAGVQSPFLRSAPLGWYAVYTAPRHEKRVAEHFAQRRIESFLPLYASRRHWKDGSKRVLQLPLFPGYIFVRIALQDRFEVLGVPGALSLVSAGTKPACLPDIEIEILRSGLAIGNAEPHAHLAHGERVRIVAGPFAGMDGLLERNSNDLRVVLKLDQIMQSFAVEVDAANVERIGERTGGHRPAACASHTA